MFRRRSFLVLGVILPGLALAAAQATPPGNTEVEALQKKVASLEKALRQEKQKRAHALGYLMGLGDRVGFPIVEPTETKLPSYRIDRDRLHERIQAHLKLFRTDYSVEVSATKFKIHEDGMALVRKNEGKLTISPLHPQSVPSEATLEALIEYYHEACSRMLKDIRRLGS